MKHATASRYLFLLSVCICVPDFTEDRVPFEDLKTDGAISPSGLVSSHDSPCCSDRLSEIKKGDTGASKTVSPSFKKIGGLVQTLKYAKLDTQTTNKEALLRRCYTCRSRGDLGTCKDPFTLNLTLAEQERGVEAEPCASGWCGKFLEGGNSFKDDEYGVATQRMCLQRGPSDSEERCDYITWNHKRVYMCFCQGDLCNGALSVSRATILLVTLTALRHIIIG